MSTLTPNMSLIESSIGVDSGLLWEQNLNASLDVLDGHNHTPGSGVQITPSALNINADLTMLNNDLTTVRTIRFNPQGSLISATSPDLGCLFESAGGDLYYNDGVGNQIRVTQSGAIAGTPGSITGLVAPASATYIPISTTFVWQSNVNTPANMDMGAIILRNITASSKGITIAPAASLANDYNVTYPISNPTAYSVLQTTSSGASVWQQTYNAIVGSVSQVANGSATHSTLGSAIAASSTNWTILVLQGAWTENVSITSTLNIVGSGKNSVITGTLTFTGATYANVTALSFSGNLTLDSTSIGNQITRGYIGSSATATDNGSANYIELIQG